jgi:hypothetical protein
MNKPIVTSTESPFDAIMRTDDYGNEYWSARDLMDIAGYSKWQDFRSAIDRAAVSSINQGHDPEDHFMSVHKVIEGGRWGTQTVDDLNVTRFGCYLIFQNGDPRKPEIAEAQGYFAIQTRVAETQLPQMPDITSLEGIAQLVQAAQNAVNAAQTERARADVAVVRAEKSEAVVDIIENGEGISIREFHKQYFSDCPERQFFGVLYDKKLILDQRNTVWNEKKQAWINGKNHGNPSYLGKPYFFLDASIEKATGKRRYQTKVRPGKPEVSLVAKLETFGLRSNRNQTTLSLKELF